MASDGEPADEVEAATPIAEEETPAAPASAVNGRRKSTTRKPRKKPIVSGKLETIHDNAYQSSRMKLSRPKTRTTILWRSMPIPLHRPSLFALVSRAPSEFMVALAPLCEICSAQSRSQPNFILCSSSSSLRMRSCFYDGHDDHADVLQLPVRPLRRDKPSRRKGQHPSKPQ